MIVYGVNAKTCGSLLFNVLRHYNHHSNPDIFLYNIHPFIIAEFTSLRSQELNKVLRLRLYQRARANSCPKPNQAMNNEQFRRLLQDNNKTDTRTGARSSIDNNDTKTSQARDGGGAGGATPGAALGSRMRSSIPMTPYVTYISMKPDEREREEKRDDMLTSNNKNSRSVTGVNFAQQLAEHRREAGQPPTKRFKSSAAPKGTKLPTGYQDRASQRQAQDSGAGADIEERVAALEELVKQGQIDQATFDKLRAELGVGGDVKSTHMVKGLDWDLLRRVKAGEDVSKATEEPEDKKEQKEEQEDAPKEEEEVDLDAEFERVTEEKGQEAAVPVAPKEKDKKKGTMAPPPVPTQKKKSRNELLQELKASRAAAAAQPAPPAESVLGSKFKKLSDSKPEKKRWEERDENGRRREVLLITDAQGKTKRKTRWLDKPGESSGLLVPDKSAKPLGMEVPAEIASKTAAAPAEEEDDGDIFEGVGADYNPLAATGEGDDDSSSDSDEGEIGEAKAEKTAPTEPTPPIQPSKPRNYFATSAQDAAREADEEQAKANPLTRDPNLLAAFKRAAALRQASSSGEETGSAGKDSGRGQRFLEEMRRREAQDAEDMDMGFGGSRVGDEEDEEPVALEAEGGRGGQKRKRGPKKKKGDKENVSDVMRVLDGRKK